MFLLLKNVLDYASHKNEGFLLLRCCNNEQTDEKAQSTKKHLAFFGYLNERFASLARFCSSA